ncbi:P-loop containing nucleoside triphosphate hydrolase protein [Thozetella sp. PMI_491]|nr:P-loop containing nucleoside triphosphate hydrolase protein [Thozetella sp. PMI_491]
MGPEDLGIWHTTTLQSVAERHEASYRDTNIAVGHKRTFDEAQSDEQPVPLQPTTTRRPGHSRQPSDLPKQRSKLSASAIVAIGDELKAGPSQYTQRRAFPATPSSTVDPLLSLHHPIYDLSPPLVANFASLGIKEIYPWQKQCLLGQGLLQGEKNLVYSAPTGGGKSLVADVLMLKQVMAGRDRKALLVLPYVALVQEKVRWLRNVVQGISREDLGQREPDGGRLWAPRADKDTLRVVGFFGGGKIRATWVDFDIGVCTMEKANSLINTAIDDCSIAQLKVVVLDELHMIDDDYRGYLLELMTTKILCLEQQTQIIGMSATLSNIQLLKTWMRAHSYETLYRPIPIKEHLVYEGRIYAAETTSRLLSTATHLVSSSAPEEANVNAVRTIQASEHKELVDPVLNAVVALANETARAGFGALVFARSRSGCESDALLISRVLPSWHEIDPAVQDKRLELLGELRGLATGLDPVLEQTIPAGVAFHRAAGLTTEERDLVADAYDSGIIKVCVATCSLAAGINLPARRVILHNARMGKDIVGPSMLRQMRGRAGRKGKDEIGETYLCCPLNDLDEVIDLMHAELPQISSCLLSDRCRIQRALLEIIAIRLATTRESLDDYIQRTMLYHSASFESINENVESSLEGLQAMGFITTDNYSNFQATQLGKAIVASSLDPEDGLFLHSELRNSLKAFVMDGEMHALYNFTPVHDLGSGPINWKVFWNEMEQLDESDLRVMQFLGLKPTVVNNMLHGSAFKDTTPEQIENARRYHRFYYALQLRDLCNEVPVHLVAKKYDMPRGSVQNLAQTCQGFAAGMVRFCEHMGWGVMAAALDHLSDRLRAGAKSDLLALAKIAFIKSRTARVFWDNGFKSVAAVANADPQELVPILMQAQPSKVRVEGKQEEVYKEKLLGKAKIITDSANRIWQLEMQHELDEE